MLGFGDLPKLPLTKVLEGVGEHHEIVWCCCVLVVGHLSSAGLSTAFKESDGRRHRGSYRWYIRLEFVNQGQARSDESCTTGIEPFLILLFQLHSSFNCNVLYKALIQPVLKERQPTVLSRH